MLSAFEADLDMRRLGVPDDVSASWKMRNTAVERSRSRCSSPRFDSREQLIPLRSANSSACHSSGGAQAEIVEDAGSQLGRDPTDLLDDFVDHLAHRAEPLEERGACERVGRGSPRDPGEIHLEGRQPWPS
jgi:hypothetical protein